MGQEDSPTNILGLFRKRSSPFPVILTFDHFTSTWSTTHLRFNIAEDIVQIIVLQDFVLALTSSGCVLSRSVNRNESAELVEIDNDCIKLVQVGNRCFGFFKGIDQTITVKRFQRHLGTMADIGISMEKYFSSCSRLEENGFVSLYVAGKAFKWPKKQNEPEKYGQPDSRELVRFVLDPSGSLHLPHYPPRYSFSPISCSLHIHNGLINLWLKGLTEVVRLNADTLTVKDIEYIGHERPLANQFVYPNEVILCSSGKHQILFHRRSFMTHDGQSRELYTYRLTSFSTDEQSQYWKPISTYLHADLLCIFDGKYAFACEKL